MLEESLQEPISLIVGLGNPGKKYTDTRHNAGVWFVELVAKKLEISFRPEKKFFGRIASASLEGREIKLLIPETYMNESGKSVGAFTNFFKIKPSQVLVAHDEVDFPVGKVRLKDGGGLAGHNGLRDVSDRWSGSLDFKRLRIGVGHPGVSKDVVRYVLGKMPASEKKLIDESISVAQNLVPKLISGCWQDAMEELHRAC